MQDKLQTKIAPTKDSVIFKFSVPEDYLKNDTLRTTWKDITGNVEDSSVLKGYLDSNIKNTKDELNSTIGGLTNKVNDSIKDILDRKDYEKKQINYKKCRKLFEMYLEQNPKTDEEIYAFGEKIKKEKNTANLEYMINVLAEKRKYTSARYEVLMSLSILYHMWPDLFEKCLADLKD